LDTEIFGSETLLAVHKGLEPNTNKPSTQDQNKLRKGIFILTLSVKYASGISKVVHSDIS